jgi:hypothetical protein
MPPSTADRARLAAAASDPLAAVAALHAAAGGPTADGDWGVAALFEAIACDAELAAQVRMRGMRSRRPAAGA